jgi:hypothetical protein
MTTAALQTHQLRYYIALSAPPQRDQATGEEPYLRPEMGFTPKWYHDHLEIDLDEKWHRNPDYRMSAWEKMRAEIDKRFPGRNLGHTEEDLPPDLLTGVYGGCVVSQLFGMGVQYWPDNWPASEHGRPIGDEDAARLEPVNVEEHPVFQQILEQCDRIEQLTGTVRGFLNWQGVLNTTFRLRSESTFTDMLLEPERARHVFGCVCETMLSGVKALHQRQRRAGQDYRFFSIANCVVNMLGSEQYHDFLLPYELRMRGEFENFGIHNCAWCVDAYAESYAQVPRLGYLDMGLDSDLERIRELFPDTRRNLIYTAMDVKEKSREQIREDLEKIARELGPCDIGLPNMEYGIPDEKLQWVLDTIDEISDRNS